MLCSYPAANSGAAVMGYGELEADFAKSGYVAGGSAPRMGPIYDKWIEFASPPRDPATLRVSWPAEGETLTAERVVLRGTASDGGGGVVGGVEVSVDDGRTWHPAERWEEWTYGWEIPSGAERAAHSVRAVDDSGNLEPPTPGVRVIVK